MNKDQTLDTLLSGLRWVAALVAAQWAQLTETVHILLALMFLDWLTGMISAAFVEKNLESHRGWRGISKKALTIILIGAVHLAAKKLQLGVDLGEVVALAYAVNELISIIENCHRAGVPIPEALVTSLAKFKRLDPVNWRKP